MSVLLPPAERVRIAPGKDAAFYHADCVNVLRQQPSRSIDVIVTSPPYNLGIRYNQYDDTMSRADYLEWTNAWVAEAARVLRPDGSLFLNVGAKPTDPWTALDVAHAVRPHLQLQNIIHWIKSIYIDKAQLAVGHYKPINSDRFLNDCHEFIFHFSPNGATRVDRLALGVPYQDQSNVGRWRAAAEGVRCRGNTWFIPYETIQRRDRDRPHPASFPPQLPEQCLRLHGLKKIEAVMDPFTGIGSTAVACVRLGLSFVGCEIDEVYLKEAVARTREAATARTVKVRSLKAEVRSKKTSNF
ncbi:MAG TPA: site-specific DNA-methyltransferase [Vicinamibacterales bacterium]|nr:site-specific DNA-methyltransferase [Vicinamibacterales bacterium]